MRVYLGFDDTDVLGGKMGTGKLVRLYEKKLPAGARLWGVLRHQLLVDKRIPFTSHNSPACAVVEVEDPEIVPMLIELAAQHLEELSAPGSDPGLCVAREDADLSGVMEFALSCTNSVRTQAQAKAVTSGAGVHLSGHGGTNDGIIGATAAVGLSKYGWSGRFLEFGGGLRDLPDPVTVADLRARNIQPVPLDNDATVLSPDTLIFTRGWPKARFWAGQAVLPVYRRNGQWLALAKKRSIVSHVRKAASVMWIRAQRALDGNGVAKAN